MQPASSPPPRFPSRLSLVAAASAIAPFLLQTAVMVATRSSLMTLFAGLALALLLIGIAFRYFAREVGGMQHLSLGTRTGIALAVLTYHTIAFPVAHIVEAMFFSQRAG